MGGSWVGMGRVREWLGREGKGQGGWFVGQTVGKREYREGPAHSMFVIAVGRVRFMRGVLLSAQECARRFVRYSRGFVICVFVISVVLCIDNLNSIFF